MEKKEKNITEHLIDLIEDTYGHRVDYDKLVELIETSPLK